MELIPLVCGFIPLDMSVLAKVGDVFVSNLAVEKEIGNVLVLGAVRGVELVGMEIKPVGELFFW